MDDQSSGEGKPPAEQSLADPPPAAPSRAESPAPQALANGRPLEERDLVLLHSRSETGLRVIRSRAGTLEVGELRAMREGAPIHGEVVRLSPTDQERVFDVDVVMEPPRRTRPGPAQVATAAYRAQWEAIFGSGDDAPN